VSAEDVNPEQQRRAVMHFHGEVWDATVGVIDAFQVQTGTQLPVPRWADLDETRQQGFLVAAEKATNAVVALVGLIGSTPPEQDTPFGPLIGPNG
jgi:hypothetical protein